MAHLFSHHIRPLLPVAVLALLLTPPLDPSFAQPVSADRADLQVDILDCRTDQGVIAISIFRSSDGFPGRADKAVSYQIIPIKNKRATTVFSGLPPGDYALTFIHDENQNGKIDTNLLGIPTEGYGASNDARGTFGPPKFEDARFELKAPRTTVQVHTHYFPLSSW